MRIIAGEFRGRTLKTAAGPGMRPAAGRVREALFSMLEARGITWEESSVLDLFAGSGSLAFEAASRGAKSVALVESSARAVRCLEHNARSLGLFPPRCRILHEDALRLLRRWGRAGAAREGEPFTLVFLDPPYGKQLAPAALRLLVDAGRLAPRALVLAETESGAVPEEAGRGRLPRLAERAYGQTRIEIRQYEPNNSLERKDEGDAHRRLSGNLRSSHERPCGHHPPGRPAF
jgi:16S rRNA (guanine966-N2)-methyltransferase